MNLHRISLVQTTFMAVQAETTLFVARLYDHLFRLDPHLCSLFPEDWGGHGEQFMVVLAEIVAGLDRPFFLIQYTLKPLGRRHAPYGIQSHHYHAAAAALRHALADTLGPTFTPEVESAWMDAYYLVAGVLREVSGYW